MPPVDESATVVAMKAVEGVGVVGGRASAGAIKGAIGWSSRIQQA